MEKAYIGDEAQSYIQACINWLEQSSTSDHRNGVTPETNSHSEGNQSRLMTLADHHKYSRMATLYLCKYKPHLLADQVAKLWERRNKSPQLNTG